VLNITSQAYDREQFQLLRQLEHLAVVDVELDLGAKVPIDWEKTWVIWEEDLLSVLGDSPSADRKVLRWKVVRYLEYPGAEAYDAVENEEFEVSQEELL
jgi:hypothetical protein